MRRTFLLSLLVLSCLFLSGCSGYADFVLVNESDMPIEVEYQADMRSYGPKNGVPNAFIPRVISYEKWGTSHKDKDWSAMAEPGYSVDVETGRFKLILPARTALKIARLSDMVFYKDNYKEFELISLSVRGRYGSFAYEGIQLYREFTEKGKNVCSVTYKKG